MKTVEVAHAALTNGEALPIRHVLVMAAGSTTDTAIGTKRGSRKLLVLVLSDSTELIIVRLEDYLAWVELWSVIFAKIIRKIARNYVTKPQKVCTKFLLFF